MKRKQHQSSHGRRTTRTWLAVFTAASVLLPSMQYARGGSETWLKTTGVSNPWNSNGAGNWNPDTAFPNGNADVATLSAVLAVTTMNVTLNQAISLNGLTLVSGNAGRNYVIAAGTGGTLTLDGANPFITSSQGNANTITAPLSVASSATGTLTLGGGVGSFTVGNISSTSLALLINGSTWTLNGTNSFTGTTRVAGGVLNINTPMTSTVYSLGGGTTVLGVSNALPTSSAVTLGGGFLSIGAFSPTVASVAMGGGGIIGTGALTSASNYAFSGGDAYAGLAGGVALNKTGDGTVVLAGTNTFTGATTATGGALFLDYNTNNNSKLADAASLTLSNGASVYVVGGSHNEVVSSTTINAGATTIGRLFGGTSTLQMGTITRAVGTLINFNASGVASTNNTNTSGVLGGWATVGGTDWATNSTNGSNGSITALASGGYTNDTWAAGNNTTVTGNSTQAASSTTNSLRFNAATPSTVNLSGTNVISSGGVLVTSAVGNNLQTITGGSIAGSSGGELDIHQFNTANGLTINSNIADNGLATALVKDGSGTLTLGGSNAYTGNTYLYGGTLALNYTTNNNQKLGGTGTTLTLGGEGVPTAISLTAGSTVETVSTTAINAGFVSISRVSGTGVLQMGDITTNRAIGGAVNFAAVNIAKTTSSNTSGILGGWATVGNPAVTNGLDWAAVDGSGNITSLTGAGGSYDTSISDWVGGAIPGANVSLDASSDGAPSGVVSLTADTTINSLRITQTTQNSSIPTTVNLNGKTLTIASGGILHPKGGNTNGPTEVISGGTLLAGVGKDFVINVSQTVGASGLAISAVIADNGGPTSLTKTGPNALRLDAVNTYTGTTYIDQGTLVLNGTTGGSVKGAIVIGSGGVLASYWGNAGSGFVTNDLSGGGAFVSSEILNGTPNGAGGNTTILTGNNTYGGGTIIGGAPNVVNAIQIGNGGTTGTAGTGPIFLSTAAAGAVTNTRTLTFNRGNTYQVDNQITNGSGTSNPGLEFVVDAGTGTLILNNVTSDYVGSTAITGGGILSVPSLASANSPSPIGAASNSAANLQVLANGTLRYTGTGDSTDRLFSIGNTASTLNSAGSGAMNFTGSGSIGLLGTGTTPVTLNLIGGVNGTNTLAPLLGNRASVATALTKDGAGTWKVTGANTYTGPTTVTNGTLILDPAGSLGFGGAVGLAGAAAGGVGGAGVGNTTIASGSTIDLNGATVNEPIVLSGGSLLNNNLSTPAKVNDGIAGIALNGTGSGYSTTPTVGISGGGGTGATATAGLGLTALSVPAGSVSGGTGYSPGSVLTLTGGGGTGAQVTVVTAPGNNAITAFSFLTAGYGYTSAPTGSVVTSGTGNNNATVTGNATSFQVSGISLNSAGSGYTSVPTVTLSSGAATATAVLSSIALSSTSNIGGDGNMDIPLAISGAGGLTKVGAGTLNLTGANAYIGATTVSAGTLLAGANAPSGSNGALGNATSPVTLGDANTTTNNSNAALLTGGAFTVARAVTVANQATAGIYTLGGNANANSTFSGLVTLNQPLTVSQVATTGGNALSITGGITSGGGAKTVTFAGPGAINVGATAISDGAGAIAVTTTGGTTTLSAANTYSGATTITGGTLALSTGTTNNIANSTTISVGGGTFLDTTAVTGFGGFKLASGQTIKGTGTVTGNLTVGSNSTLSPGNSPGILNETGTQTWLSGGNYNWQMLNATGAAGVGYDQMAISGGLDLSLASGFNLNLWSLSSVTPDTNGNATFNPLTNGQSWIIATTTGITGVPTGININTAATNGTGGFTNSLSGGIFRLSVSGNNLLLNFDTGAMLSLAPTTNSFGRVMLGQTPTINPASTLSNTGTLAATSYTAVAANNGITATPLSGALSGGGTTPVSVSLVNNANGSGTTGVKNYTYTVTDNTNVSDTGGNKILGVDATVLDNRTVTATPISIGRIIVTTSPTGTSNLSTTGSDDNFTRVNVATTSSTIDGVSITGGPGTLYDSASATGTRTLGGTFASTGAKNINLTLTTTSAETGGPLAGESPINVLVNLQATAVANRDLSGGVTSNLGPVIVGVTTPSAAGTIEGGAATDDNATRVNIANGSATSGVVTAVYSGGPFTFNGAGQSRPVSVSGNFATAGAKSGSVNAASLLSDGETSITGAVTVDTSVLLAYTADAYDRSNGSFATGLDQDALTIPIGIFVQGSGLHNAGFLIANLLQTAGFTAGLDLLAPGISGTGDVSELFTNVGAFSNLSAGTSGGYNATLDASLAPGIYSATWTFAVKDNAAIFGNDYNKVAFGTSPLVLTLTGQIVAAPEPASLVILGLGAVMVLPRRKRR